MNRPSNLRVWSDRPPPTEVQQALTRLARAEDVVSVAAMPDVHLAKDVCIGTVVATEGTLYPAAVGGDIGCGMAAMAFDGSAEVLDRESRARELLGSLRRAVPIIRHSDGGAPMGPLLEDSRLVGSGLERKRSGLAREQLGTLGRGNHFLELQADEHDQLWLMVHSGSRAIGQAIRDVHLESATHRKGGLGGLDAESEEGRAYLADMRWALAFAEANRERLLEAAARVIEEQLEVEPIENSFFSCHHNHVRKESVGKRQLWVHRKGGISARKDEPGIIPGSMGTESYHVRGRGSAEALYSSSHGAGRAMSRGRARRCTSLDDLESQMRGVWFETSLAHRLRDEAPSAYRDIGRVMRAQKELTRVVRRLRPVLVCKGT
jgi:tRNA-splicing ligase RtcB